MLYFHGRVSKSKNQCPLFFDSESLWLKLNSISLNLCSFCASFCSCCLMSSSFCSFRLVSCDADLLCDLRLVLVLSRDDSSLRGTDVVAVIVSLCRSLKRSLHDGKRWSLLTIGAFPLGIVILLVCGTGRGSWSIPKPTCMKNESMCFLCECIIKSLRLLRCSLFCSKASSSSSVRCTGFQPIVKGRGLLLGERNKVANDGLPPRSVHGNSIISTVVKLTCLETMLIGK